MTCASRRSSPSGSLEEVCEKLIATRERYGINYFAAPIDAQPEVLAPVIEALLR